MSNDRRLPQCEAYRKIGNGVFARCPRRDTSEVGGKHYCAEHAERARAVGEAKTGGSKG